jgi:hypothetical protein
MMDSARRSDDTNARKTTVRRFGRSDRRALADFSQRARTLGATGRGLGTANGLAPNVSGDRRSRHATFGRSAACRNVRTEALRGMGCHRARRRRTKIVYEIDSHDRATVGSVLAAVAQFVARPFVWEESAFGNELRDGIERVSSEKRVRDDPDLDLRELSTLMTRRMSRGHCHHVLGPRRRRPFETVSRSRR